MRSRFAERPDRTIDELLDAGIILHNGHIAGLVEALREARALLAHVEIQGGHAAGSAGPFDKATAIALLAKWRGE